VLRGVQLGWPLCRWVRWPVTPAVTRPAPGLDPLLSSTPPPYRRLPAGGWGSACSRLIGRCRSSKYMPRHRVIGCNTHLLATRFQTGHAFLLQAIFTICWPDLVPIQTVTPQRKSGPRIALPAHARLYYPVDMWPRSTTRGFALRRPARCSVITRRARVHAATTVLRDRLRFCMCGLVLFVTRVRAGQLRRKTGLPHPGREPRAWLSACRRRAKRPSNSTRQANEVGRMS
jgi:hypothetical protein